MTVTFLRQEIVNQSVLINKLEVKNPPFWKPENRYTPRQNSPHLNGVQSGAGAIFNIMEVPVNNQIHKYLVDGNSRREAIFLEKLVLENSTAIINYWRGNNLADLVNEFMKYDSKQATDTSGNINSYGKESAGFTSSHPFWANMNTIVKNVGGVSKVPTQRDIANFYNVHKKQLLELDKLLPSKSVISAVVNLGPVKQLLITLAIDGVKKNLPKIQSILTDTTVQSNIRTIYDDTTATTPVQDSHGKEIKGLWGKRYVRIQQLI